MPHGRCSGADLRRTSLPTKRSAPPGRIGEPGGLHQDGVGPGLPMDWGPAGDYSGASSANRHPKRVSASVFRRIHHFARRVTTGLAVLATLALMLHGVAHAHAPAMTGVHGSIGHHSMAAHLAGGAEHAHGAPSHAAGDGSHSSHAQHDHPGAPEMDRCCCGSVACTAVLLPPPVTSVPDASSRSAGAHFSGSHLAGFTPDGLRRPPRPTVIA
jgi:hypothetical protein